MSTYNDLPPPDYAFVVPVLLALWACCLLLLELLRWWPESSVRHKLRVRLAARRRRLRLVIGRALVPHITRA